MEKLSYNFLDQLEKEDKERMDATLLAAIIAQQFEQIAEMKRQLVELHSELCKREAEQKPVLILNEEKARELLNMGRDKFRKIYSDKNGFKFKIRLNGTNSKFFDIENLIEYKNYVFSENFQFDNCFFNPDFFKSKRVTEADLKRFNINPKKKII